MENKEKNIAKDLEMSKMFLTFASRTGEILPKSSRDIFKTAISAASSGDDSTLVKSTCSQNKGGVAILFGKHKQILSLMRTGKNLKASVQGTSVSTPTGAKSVLTPFFSKGRYIYLKGCLNRAERQLADLKASQTLHTYRVKLLTYYYESDRIRSQYVIDKEYKATSRAEAFGLASIEMGQIMPHYSIAPISMGGVQLCTKIS